jgi:hypothetical protein
MSESMGSGAMSAAAIADKVFEALANTTRRAIFASLILGEMAVKDLTALRWDHALPRLWVQPNATKWRAARHAA